MKGQLDRTKAVVRHLPPTIMQSALMEHIDVRFAGRYNWVSFRPGNHGLGQKHQCYARAYIDFKRQEDIVHFAEFFDGHVFVNEKGTQLKAIVEYAPSQRVPKQCLKKYAREGTLFKDPEYLEFLEFLEKPVENLPSAEIQLEKREAERVGTEKNVLVVTPLMDFVRQIRAAKGGSRVSFSNGKPTRKSTGTSIGNPNPSSLRRGSDKRRIFTSMYVLRDSAKRSSGVRDSAKSSSVEGTPIHTLDLKGDDEQQSCNSVAAVETEASEKESGEAGKKKILLLKGRAKEISDLSGGLSSQPNATSVKNLLGASAMKQSLRCEGSGRIIKSMLLESHSSSMDHSEQQIMALNWEKDKRSRPLNFHLLFKDAKGAPEDKVAGSDLHGCSGERQERSVRNNKRPDRGVWAPLHRSGGSHASGESLSSSMSQPTRWSDSTGGSYGDPAKIDSSHAGGGERRTVPSGRGGYSSLDNGFYKHDGRRGFAHELKDAYGSSVMVEGKQLKKGGSSGYGSHEKQMWVQKSSTGS